jgi:hypothetical protein
VGPDDSMAGTEIHFKIQIKIFVSFPYKHRSYFGKYFSFIAVVHEQGKQKQADALCSVFWVIFLIL